MSGLLSNLFRQNKNFKKLLNAFPVRSWRIATKFQLTGKYQLDRYDH